MGTEMLGARNVCVGNASVLLPETEINTEYLE